MKSVRPFLFPGAVSRPRLQGRFPQLLVGVLFTRGRRSVTAWFRAAGVTDAYRQGYRTLAAASRQAELLATASRPRRSPPSFASAAWPTIPLTARTDAPPRSCSRCTTLNASSAVSEARFRSPSSREPAGPSVRQSVTDAARVRAGPADAGGPAQAGRTGGHKEDL